MFPIVLFCDNSASYIIVPGSMRNTSRNGVITLNNEKASTKKKKKILLWPSVAISRS